MRGGGFCGTFGQFNDNDNTDTNTTTDNGKAMITLQTIDEAFKNIDNRFSYVTENSLMMTIKSWIKDIVREMGV